MYTRFCLQVIYQPLVEGMSISRCATHIIITMARYDATVSRTEFAASGASTVFQVENVSVEQSGDKSVFRKAVAVDVCISSAPSLRAVSNWL